MIYFIIEIRQTNFSVIRFPKKGGERYIFTTNINIGENWSEEFGDRLSYGNVLMKLQLKL